MADRRRRRPAPGDAARRPGPEAREERRRRAIEEALDVRPRSDRPYPSFEVRNPIHATHYRVLAPGPADDRILLCPCPDFGRRDVGTCKHVEAVRGFLEGSAPATERAAPPTGRAARIWASIDAALGREVPVPWRDLRDRYRTGRCLIDGGEGEA